MAKKKILVIVESPSKIKTLKKFLGDSYSFSSSLGHIRDLPPKEMGIDIQNDFEPTYAVLPDKEDHVKKLIQEAKKADLVVLAPDPDREGEAIAWHLKELFPKETVCERVSFNAITKSAVQEALSNPREIDMHLVDAQQARRILDRLVGYTLSPLLNRRIQRGKNNAVSAGRVQSVALKCVVDREKEILAFIPQEFWDITALLSKKMGEKNFMAKLFSIAGVKVDREEKGNRIFLVHSKEEAERLFLEAQKGPFVVESLEKKERKRNPQAPFITSTLQQEASRHFSYSSSRTMSLAQELYEGIDLENEGREGLITYMRTDSVRISPEALTDVRKYIEKSFGKEYLSPAVRNFATKKSAQDAHEAIRPTDVSKTPEMLKPFLSRELWRLYDLIWKRFVASQMQYALYDTVTLDISSGESLIFRATGSLLKHKGYLAVYQEMEDEKNEENEDKILPPLEKGDSLFLEKLEKEQKFTRPPPRFTEASLVKELERLGIGRPSTYATIMNKIQSREYTVKEEGRLKPTELGFVISDFLADNFKKIVETDFTARMEDELEQVASAALNWKSVIREFWQEFDPALKKAEEAGFVPKVTTDYICPECGKPLQKIWFKSKYFLGCSGYPECNFSSPVEEFIFDKQAWNPDFDWDQLCPQCHAEMKLRHGRFGPFLGCSRYPDCRGIVNIPEKGVAVEEVACPALGCPGVLKQRRSRFGKIFYSCSTYPECDVIGSSLENVAEKYQDHPRTPAPVKEKKKTPASKKTTKTTKEKTTKKTTSSKKPTVKRKKDK